MVSRSELIEKARELNRILTGIQPRISGELAIDHTERVGERVAKVAGKLGEPRYAHTVCAGYLHDVIEDTVNWENCEAYDRRCAQIAEDFGPVILRIVLAVTVDQRLPYPEQFAISLRRAREEYGIEALLVRRADIQDNWETRHVYEPEYRACWEQYAVEMLTVVIPERLKALGWED